MINNKIIQKEKIHWQDNKIYFLTSSTFLHYPYFKTEDQKRICLDKIAEIKRVLNIPIMAYSIAINHIHLKFYLEFGRTMTQLKNILHSGISREYRKRYECQYSEFWQSSKIYHITDNRMSWKVTGYIIGNLLKHKEISTFEELKENPFSSYKYTAEKFGDNEARDLVYRVIDTGENAEGEVDMSALENIVL